MLSDFSYKISREFEHADCVTKYKKLVIEISMDDSGSVSEPVFGSDIEKETKSDFKRGSESVFDFDPRVGFGFLDPE